MRTVKEVKDFIERNEKNSRPLTVFEIVKRILVSDYYGKQVEYDKMFYETQVDAKVTKNYIEQRKLDDINMSIPFMVNDLSVPLLEEFERDGALSSESFSRATNLVRMVAHFKLTIPETQKNMFKWIANKMNKPTAHISDYIAVSYPSPVLTLIEKLREGGTDDNS